MSISLRLAPALLVVFCATAVSAAAQAPPVQGPPKNPMNQPRLFNPAEVQSIIDGYVIVQAEKVLTLTDDQFPQFVTRLRALQETRRRNLRAHNQLIQEIARLANASPAADEAVLRDKLKALDETDQRSAADLRKAYENVDQILDVRQQARFRVFLEQVERRMLDILTRARAQAQPAAGRRGRG